MIKYVVSLVILAVSFTANAQTNKAGSLTFWENLKKHCGKSYQGDIVAGAKEGDGFTGQKLVMHVKSCEENRIRIPFNVGDDLSRTWILTLDEKNLIQLKHDHRHQDGSEDQVTQYGGKASNTGFENLQMFPADQYTSNLIGYASGNVWWITLDNKKFTYNLRRVGTDRIFSVSFNLEKPVETPPSPWGWKD